MHAGRPPRPQLVVDLVADLLELVGAEAEALGDVERRMVAAAEPEDVAIGEYPLVAGPERHVRVRVLGELEHPVGRRHRCQASR